MVRLPTLGLAAASCDHLQHPVRGEALAGPLEHQAQPRRLGAGRCRGKVSGNSYGKLGDPERLSELVRRLRPDITDTDALVLFELKPDNEASRGEGREQAGRYLAALNAVVESDKKLTGGPASRGRSSSNSRTGEHSGSCPGARQSPE